MAIQMKKMMLTLKKNRGATLFFFRQARSRKSSRNPPFLGNYSPDKPMVYPVHDETHPKQTWKHSTPLRFVGYPHFLSGDVIRSELLLQKSLTPK